MKKILLLISALFLIAQISFGKVASNYAKMGLQRNYISLNVVPGIVDVSAGFLVNEMSSIKKSAPNFAFFANNNTIKVSEPSNPFFKIPNAKNIAAVEKNRVWLNLTNAGGAFKQLLVGYITGATNHWDKLYDAISFDANMYIDFYSINDGKKLVIQGRALPFTNADEVPLGYRTIIEGTFEISISQVDGVLVNQDVFIEDKNSGVFHNLKNGPYSFTTMTGTFNDRFVLVYVDKTVVEVPPVVVVPPVVADPIVDVPVVNPIVTDPIVEVPPVVTVPPVVPDPIVDLPVVTDPIVEVPPVVAVPPVVPDPIVDVPVVTDPIVEVPPVVAVPPVVPDPIVDVPVVTDPIVEVPPVVAVPPVVPDPIVDLPVVTDPIVEVPPVVAVPPVVPDPIVDVPVVTDPIVEVPPVVAVPPVVPDPIVDVPVVIEPIVELPVVIDPIVELPVVTDPIVDVPVVIDPIVELPVVIDPIVELPVVTNPIVDAPVVKDPIVEVPVIDNPFVTESVVATPIVFEIKQNRFDSHSKPVIVSVNDHQIKVNSTNEKIDKIMVYNLGGRQLYEVAAINSTEFVIPNVESSNKFLIIRTLLTNGKGFVNKIVF
ncbi:T9SS sorting signal type C domain-containing protein [Flavobacterium sp. N3904]|uniref:T9SS sorting signal type C domain-containing protein n=1 Tax=Flavobacterium sp. N3904 TaxID=2986835 RepID=UPI00222563BC|nr:T9SS sorting signal type C domain-containing protein [Flavobacterium sp. N3904]